MDTACNGILVIDKTAGMSSATIVAIVKRLLRVSKVGHAGTLDPFATGLLVICINQATKLARFWLNSTKTYTAELCLGTETDTQDVTGTVVSTAEVPDFPEDALRAVLSSFSGTMNQIPPVYSALKHQGVPLYKLARQGKPVQKPARPIEIFHLDIQEIALPVIRFEVRCSAGTYIRTLCADMGKALGCGGHLSSLRRTACSGFSLSEAITLSELGAAVDSGDIDRHLIGMAESLQGMPSFQADKTLTDKIKYGMMISMNDVPSTVLSPDDHQVKIVDGNNRLLSILSYDPARNDYSYCCSFPSG
jgi:tRNA pseudouridine55 synthase